MAHQSENANRLSIQTMTCDRLGDFPQPSVDKPEVWLFILPFEQIGNTHISRPWLEYLHKFAEYLHNDSVVGILTSVEDAANIWPQICKTLQFQLWITIKLSASIAANDVQLPNHHAVLLILSKYRSSLRHTKTRIGYTYCPYCDKTTKDYGGKKHTYHEYGTLLSDVWRDISYTPGIYPMEIVSRMADLFGLAPYSTLITVNLVNAKETYLDVFQIPGRIQVENNSSSVLASTLINDDVLGSLERIPSDSIDFCFADPPYNLAKHYDSWDDALDMKKYLEWCDQWLAQLARVLKPGCTCAVLNIPLLAIEHFHSMKRSLEFQTWIAWEGLSLPVRMIMPANYSIVCFSKGSPRPLPGLSRKAHSEVEKIALTTLKENYCIRQSCVSSRKGRCVSDRESITDLWWDIHRLKHNSRRVDHPCQLPPTLMRRLVSLFTDREEIVLDPFNGAGTTTLCADALSRRYIGIELSEKYHQIAVARHDHLRNGGDPFGKSSDIPDVKNSRVNRVGGIKYEIPKKTLQLEVKRVSNLIGHIPTREELGRLGRYNLRYYDEYFVSWGEVCAAARTTGMTEIRTRQIDLLEQDLLKAD